VAWHHKGLACRALWHIVGKYSEAKLYTNSARKGKKKRVRKQQAYSRLPRNGGTSAAATVCCQNFNLISLSPDRRTYQSSPAVQTQSFLNSMDEGYQSMLHDAEATGVQDIPSSSPEAPRRAPPPRQLPTLPPWKYHEIGHVPTQLKKRDFFDTLRTNNPPAKHGGSRQYLEQAKKCFEEAKAITNGTCSPYVVDLARSLISLGEYDAAEREFRAASVDLASTMNNNDATYLYEQWALLRHGRANAGKTPQKRARWEMKDVAGLAALYRQAILSAVRARARSRVAFYNLLDLLNEELQQDARNEAARMEYNVLHNSAQSHGECNEMLVESLRMNAETRDIALHLIHLLRDRRHPHDAATAFTYLAALHEAEQLHLDEATRPDTDDTVITRQLLIDVVRQLIRDGDQTNADGARTFAEIFRWMIGSGHISDHIPLDGNSLRPFADSGEVCILAPCDDAPGVDTVLRVLRDVCGIVVVTAYPYGNCDMRDGSPTLEGLRAVVAISQAVVVVEHSTDTDNWSWLSPVLDELMKIGEVRVCFVADEQTDCSATEQRYAKRWKRVIIKQDCDDVELACSFLKAMFL